MSNPDVTEKQKTPAASTPASGWGDRPLAHKDEQPEREAGLAATTGSPSVDFVKRQQWSDACMAGAEAAQEIRLPRISERCSRPDLLDAWLHGFVTEIRNRMENGEVSD